MVLKTSHDRKSWDDDTVDCGKGYTWPTMG